MTKKSEATSDFSEVRMRVEKMKRETKGKRKENSQKITVKVK